MKYSIHRCLAELKTLDSRIKKATDKKFIGCKKLSAKKEAKTNLAPNDFEKEVIGNYDSVIALIRRRNKIKEAVVNSNATTMVEIGGKIYTVASAIERKESIEYEKNLLIELKLQYNNVLATVNNLNDKVEEQLEKKIDAMVGAENASKNVELVESFSKQYMELNAYEVLDYLNLKELIDKLEKEIDDFETEVDFKLSTSNSITEVEIED